MSAKPVSEGGRGCLFFDRGFEFRDIAEDASADALARDLGEEPLDEIEPRTGSLRVNVRA